MHKDRFEAMNKPKRQDAPYLPNVDPKLESQIGILAGTSNTVISKARRASISSALIFEFSPPTLFAGLTKSYGFIWG